MKVAVFAGGLTLFNMGMDQVSNPQLKGSKNLKRWKKLNDELEAQRKAKLTASKGKSQDGGLPV